MAKIAVEVAYALKEKQKIIKLQVEKGITAEQAAKLSGIEQEFKDFKLADSKLGIFGKITERDTVLRSGDRVEIYRDLIADPKEVRRQRAAAGKKMRRGGGNENPDSKEK